MAKIFIGTSGWHYKHWVGNFYPDKMKPPAFLEHYLKFYNTLELNNSFYHLPSAETFKNWRENTPKDFIFSVKASRYITHMKKLKEPEEGFGNFITNTSALKEKLGPILFQLPPGWAYNAERFQAFVEFLPKEYLYTFEFRNESWYNEEVYELLNKHNIAFCIYDLGGHQSPVEVTANFVYMRLHGPGDKYQGSYPDKALAEWAGKMEGWRKKRKDVYCYFDNDIGGHAPKNAIKLKELLNI